jgi:hypothetical protein
MALQLAESKYITGMIQIETVEHDGWEFYHERNYDEREYIIDTGYSRSELKNIFANRIFRHCVDNYFMFYICNININDKINTIADIYNCINDDDEEEFSCSSRFHGFKMRICQSVLYIVKYCYDRRKWPIVAIELDTLYPIITPQNPL